MKFSVTDEKIFFAFCSVVNQSRSYSDITMAKVANQLGISRQALYKSYYHNIDEIYNALHLYISQPIYLALADFLSKHTTFTNAELLDFFLDELTPLLYQKRAYLATLHGPLADPTWYAFVEKKYAPLLAEYIDSPHRDLMALVLVRQALAIAGAWMKQPAPENPVLFKQTFKLILTTPLQKHN